MFKKTKTSKQKTNSVLLAQGPASPSLPSWCSEYLTSRHRHHCSFPHFGAEWEQVGVPGGSAAWRVFTEERNSKLFSVGIYENYG